MSARTVTLEVTPLEATHLTALATQFLELLDGTAVRDDPALARLVPDAYADAAAAAEFRALTQRDLLDRRAADAATVIASLERDVTVPAHPESAASEEPVTVALGPDAAAAWLRTLAALRLVLASRLGITEADDHDAADPRFGVYDWLGYRLDTLVGALDA